MAFDLPALVIPGEDATDTWANKIRNSLAAFSDARTMTWTPTITATSLNVTYTLREGRYILIGKLCIADFVIVLATVTSTGSGTYTISLPVDPRAPANGLNRIGTGEAYDANVTTGFMFTAVRSGASAMQMRRDGTSQYVGAAAPFTPAANDEFAAHLMFEVA